METNRCGVATVAAGLLAFPGMTFRDPSKLWFYLRMGLFGFCFVQAFANAWSDSVDVVSEAAGCTSMKELLAVQSVFAIVCAVAMPFGCLLVRTMERLVRQQKLWQRPSLSISPFARHKPLQFWFTVAMMFTAVGLGLFLGTPWRSVEDKVPGLAMFLPALGLFAGIRISLWLFRRRFAAA